MNPQHPLVAAINRLRTNPAGFVDETRKCEKLSGKQQKVLERRLGEYHPGRLPELVEHSFLDEGCRSFIGDSASSKYLIIAGQTVSSYTPIEEHVKHFTTWAGEHGSVTWNTKLNANPVVALAKILVQAPDWEDFKPLFNPAMQYIGIGVGPVTTGVFVAEDLMSDGERRKREKRVEAIRRSVKEFGRRKDVVSLRWSIDCAGRKVRVRTSAKVRVEGGVEEVVTDQLYD